MLQETAIIGVADHCGWAVTVTIAGNKSLVDRRTIKLVDDNLPKLPHHHEAQALPLAQAKRPSHRHGCGIGSMAGILSFLTRWINRMQHPELIALL